MKLNKFTTIIHCLAIATLASMNMACRQDDENLPGEGKGTIVLSLGDAQLFSELETRAEVAVNDISHYTFTLSGTTLSGAVVTDQPLVLDDEGKAEVNAGTYILSANNADYANTDYGHPLYNGTSAAFTINVNESKTVAIALGKPKNARITLAIDDSFTALYGTPSLTISDGERSLTLTTDIECYFNIPASGALAYTVSAPALAGSHATDIASATGYVDILSGYNTTIRLKANPVSGIIIPVVEGEYAGTFD